MNEHMNRLQLVVLRWLQYRVTHLVPLGIEEQLPGLDEDVGAVGVPGHDGLLHHPPLTLPHHDGHAGGEEHALPVPQVCPAVNEGPRENKNYFLQFLNLLTIL